MNQAGDDDAFAALTSKISRDRGFGAPHYKSTCMRRRIAVRMRARGVPDFGAYGHLLDHDPDEYAWLVDALTVNVTRLFRDAPAWDAVARTVLPALWSAPSPWIDCWVAGCASGEEAFTLASLGLQYASEHGVRMPGGRWRITATDIDGASLAAAEAGVYAGDAFAEAPRGMRDRWFVPGQRAGWWSAGEELRATVRFERRDLLLEAAPRAALRLITCRNVIIYFDRRSIEALVQRFHDALVPGGFLVLGLAETLLGPSRALFESVDSRQRIFRRA